MAHAKGKAYDRGFQAGREQTLLALSILIDAYPRTLSKATVQMIGDEPLVAALNTQLKRFADETPRRRRASAPEAGESDEAVQ